MRPCNDEELHDSYWHDNDEYEFVLCPSSLKSAQFMGAYPSKAMQYVIIQTFRCDNEHALPLHSNECKDSREIDTFLQKNNLLFWYNQ